MGPKVPLTLVRAAPRADDALMKKLIGLTAAIALFTATCGGTVNPSPTPTPTATASQATPLPTSSAFPARVDHLVVYFARDRLPPVAVHVPGAGTGATAEARIRSRLEALFTTAAPAGLFNVALTARATPAAVRIDGGVATVDFTVPQPMWGVGGSAGTLAFMQQLIYTITEEPGITSALITENGHEALIGEGILVDRPATRERVSGYVPGSTAAMTWRTEPRQQPVSLDIRRSIDSYALGLARFVFDSGLRGVDAKADLGFTVTVTQNNEQVAPDLGKWVLSVSIPGAVTDEPAEAVVDQTPVRAVKTMVTEAGVRYDIGLDDLRPWRTAMLYEPLRLVVDIGGDPGAVSPNIALYKPGFGTTVLPGAAFSGMIRAFEAQFEYRIHDARGQVTTAYARGSIGTAELWGTFEVQLPVLPPGAATLEIVLRSPKDGEIQESVFTSFDYGP